MATRPPHPAEVDFKAWADSWLTTRAALARATGERLPSPEALAAEMMAKLQADLADLDGPGPEAS